LGFGHLPAEAPKVLEAVDGPLKGPRPSGIEVRVTASSSFSVASYNVLASAYIHAAWYRRTPAIVLQPEWRVPALVQRVSALATDVICLQEVEHGTFAALRTRLGPMGYAAQYTRREAGRPDGCAIFYREELFDLVAARVIAYTDGDGDIALVVSLHAAGRVVSVANTHVAWEPPDTPPGAQRRRRKIRQLLAECESMAHSCHAWLICGDLNATPGSKVVAALERAGLQYAHCGLADAYTCNANAEAKMIDYLFHSTALRAEPEPVPRISDETPLPSAEQPSDHLPVVSRFYWKTWTPER
jgi:mRNA deadenylase 3'-5' endonuclease subunit Ccr4